MTEVANIQLIRFTWFDVDGNAIAGDVDDNRCLKMAARWGKPLPKLGDFFDDGLQAILETLWKYPLEEVSEQLQKRYCGPIPDPPDEYTVHLRWKVVGQT